MGNGPGLDVLCPASRGCNYYRVDVVDQGDWGSGSRLNFNGAPSSARRECIDSWIRRADTYCAGSKRGGNVDARDDCVAMFLLGDAYRIGGLRSITGDWYIYEWARQRNNYLANTAVCSTFAPMDWYNQGVCLSGSVYFDTACNMVRAPSSGVACSSAVYGWRASPISLVWGPEDESNELVLRTFELSPEPGKDWHVWKASAALPLLVFDPEHKGKIASGRQLFGSITFGGQPSGMPWSNGYDALATLDADNNGMINGRELEPLALWFDENRDAVSQPEEVKALSHPSVAVTALYYRNTKKSDNGDVVAETGFDRLADGKFSKGKSIDWFTENAATKEELLSKIATVSRIEVQNKQAKKLEHNQIAEFIDAIRPPNRNENQTIPADAGARTKPPVFSELSGLWQWETDDKSLQPFKEHKPQGYLTFSDLGDGRLRGHSYVETSYAQGEALRSQIDVIEFSGEKTVQPNGEIKVTFSFSVEGNGVASTALLSRGGSTLQGISETKADYQGKPSVIKYTWVARKIH